MANIKAQLAVMLALQDTMNRKVHTDWQQQGYAWYRALWIECAELMDHHGYKWWKKQHADIEQVQLEIVDIWHFGLSMLFDGRDIDAIAEQLERDIDGVEIEPQSVLVATEALAEYALSNKYLSVPAFMNLLAAAGMSFDELYLAYVGKNVLNLFRQDNGYKDGSYVKNWAGREDNEHLVEIATSLDRADEAFPDRLYNALLLRYQSLSNQ